ncbi:MAG: hypothetical protein KGH75_00030 [Rhodospirillales bacterium]|nr:hypothetical protein [Rhodospirillales bacterium]
MLLRDVFPAEVSLPRSGGHHLAARAFVTDGRIIVYAAPDRKTPQVVLDEPYTSEPPTRSRNTLGAGELRFDTALGPVFVAQDSGCGCGSPLKALDPPVAW